MLEIRPLDDAPFGAEALGVDVAGELADTDMRALVAALHAHRFLVIRGQAPTLERYLAFGEAWGTPHPHALDHLRLPGFPAILPVGNTMAMHRDPSVRNGAAFWHTDQSYEAEPASATMLYAVKVPERGGETLICDLAGAYDALPEATRRRIDGLVALHLYGAASGRDGEQVAAPIRTEHQRDTLPPVRHRLARPHPVTGRTVLYGVAGTPYAIEGMADDEAAALLEELKSHALQARFIYRHRYRVGDLAIWDTNQTLHSGTAVAFATSERDARLLYRISVKGRPRVCA